MKKIIIVLILVAAGFAGVFYFRNDLIKNFQETPVGSVLTQVGKEILTPPPLKIGGAKRNVALESEKIIQETSLQRQENGLSALKENTKLGEAAFAKANDMFEKQYFEHESPQGKGPGELAKEYGYDWIVVGENLILGNFSSEKEMVQAWMNSPGHRANILNNKYTEIGVALVRGEYEGEDVWIGVQEFGLPSSSCPQISEADKTQIEQNESQLNFIEEEIKRVNSEINGVKRKDSNYNGLINEYNALVEQYNALASQTKNMVANYNELVDQFNQCIQSK